MGFRPFLVNSSWRTAGQVLLGMGLATAGYLAARFLGFWLLYLYYLVSIAAMSWVDLQERRIPNRIVYPAIPRGSRGWHRAARLADLPVGWAGPGCPLAVAHVDPPPATAGAGDVKLGLLIGLVLGISWALYWAVVVAFGSAPAGWAGGDPAETLDRHSLLPLGPFPGVGAEHRHGDPGALAGPVCGKVPK